MILYPNRKTGNNNNKRRLNECKGKTHLKGLLDLFSPNRKIIRTPITTAIEFSKTALGKIKKPYTCSTLSITEMRMEIKNIRISYKINNQTAWQNPGYGFNEVCIELYCFLPK
jgi:hypothetical protein